ncbi:MAG: lanthionine synthetase LanC family protein [Egibacteraceae bacterium]
MAALAAAAGYLANAAYHLGLAAEDVPKWKTSTLLGDFALDAAWRQVGLRVTTIRWKGGRMVPSGRSDHSSTPAPTKSAWASASNDLAWRCGTRSRPWWPGMISPNEWKARTVHQPGPQRPSWCYGTPGLARAQQLAALALGDVRRQRRAEAALAGCIADDTQLSQLGDTSLCHGWAGLVQTTWRAATDAGPDSELAALLPHLHARMEQHLHHHGHQPTTGCWTAERAST